MPLRNAWDSQAFSVSVERLRQALAELEHLAAHSGRTDGSFVEALVALAAEALAQALWQVGARWARVS